MAHHDLAQLIVPGTDILHQHLEGGELELGGQWVELLLLYLLQLYPVTELPHELDPQPGLTQETKRPQLWYSWPSQHKPLWAYCALSQARRSLHASLTQSVCPRWSSSASGFSRGSSSPNFFSIWDHTAS